MKKNSLFFLLILPIFFACNKEDTATTFTVKVLKDGNPVDNQFLSLNDILFSPGNIATGMTNNDGIARLDIEDWVINEEMKNRLVLISVDQAGCGYTNFLSLEDTYTINLTTDEEVTVSIIAPDLENTNFKVGEIIPIKLKLYSTAVPFATKIATIESKSGMLNGGTTLLNIADEVNRDGELEFNYQVTNGENGFFVVYLNNIHGEEDRFVLEFDIKVE